MRLPVFLVASQVLACPVCNSASGQKVRGAILGSDVWFNLLVALLPFLVCAVVVRLVYTGAMR